MNRQRVKTFLPIILAAMLLYYDAAWAILRCCHVGEHEGVEEVLSTGGLRDDLDMHPLRSSPKPSQLDCLDVDYQIMVLAAPASPRQFQRGAATLTPGGNDLFVLKHLADGRRTNFFPSYFTRGSPFAVPSDRPIYLALSSLRI